MLNETIFAPLELKLADDGAGAVEGYGAVFGNEDSHGDIILPGAFAKVLSEHKASGTLPTMYVEHGPAMGGDRLPAGVWTHMEADERGLRLKGRISALDTDYGRRIRSLVKDGALTGLSIGYRVGAGNSTTTRGKRQIKSFDHLVEVSLVTSPSNGRARIESVKAMLGLIDKDKAVHAVASAIGLHRSSMSGGDSPTADERSQMLAPLQSPHEAMTGQRMPAGCKSAPTTIREFEMCLREMGLSRAQATLVAESSFKSIQPSGEVKDQANASDIAELAELGAALTGFSLSS